MSTDHYPKTSPRFDGPAEDIEAIRQCHRDWWAANATQETARESRNFAPGTLMFNLNGHTYYGLDEMIQVWESYHGDIATDVVELWDYRIFVSGDLAYITCEGIFPTKQRSDTGWGASNLTIGDRDAEPAPIRFRETSIARRDDGRGNATWRLWHFHCSPSAPADEARPGFGDTWTDRGGSRGGGIPQAVELPLD